ncbi:MAG: single-stranded DNA-binding protein [Candidatus Marinimicrobia bacterium]|nr:single-stranded DNA-binding protein [Candidatus Neomarinimicrobiota bacterium]
MHKNSMNKVVLVGRLGQNPEQRAIPSGTAVTNFSVATNETRKNQNGEYIDTTEWHRCVSFGKTAEYIGNYFTKGRLVYVEGRLRTRKWNDKSNVTHYTTEIMVDTAMLLDRAPQSGDGGGGGVYAPAQNNKPAPVAAPVAAPVEPSMPENEEELPF